MPEIMRGYTPSTKRVMNSTKAKTPEIELVIETINGVKVSYWYVIDVMAAVERLLERALRENELVYHSTQSHIILNFQISADHASDFWGFYISLLNTENPNSPKTMKPSYVFIISQTIGALIKFWLEKSLTAKRA